LSERGWRNLRFTQLSAFTILGVAWLLLGLVDLVAGRGLQALTQFLLASVALSGPAADLLAASRPGLAKSLNVLSLALLPFAFICVILVWLR